MELEVILLLSIYAAVCKSQVSTVDYIYVLCIYIIIYNLIWLLCVPTFVKH